MNKLLKWLQGGAVSDGRHSGVIIFAAHCVFFYISKNYCCYNILLYAARVHFFFFCSAPTCFSLPDIPFFHGEVRGQGLWPTLGENEGYLLLSDMGSASSSLYFVYTWVSCSVLKWTDRVQKERLYPVSAPVLDCWDTWTSCEDSLWSCREINGKTFENFKTKTQSRRNKAHI